LKNTEMCARKYTMARSLGVVNQTLQKLSQPSYQLISGKSVKHKLYHLKISCLFSCFLLSQGGQVERIPKTSRTIAITSFRKFIGNIFLRFIYRYDAIHGRVVLTASAPITTAAIDTT